MPRFNPVLDHLPTYPQQALEAKKAAIIKAGKPLYDFGVGDPRESAPAFIRERLAASVPANCRYPTVSGSLEFRQSVAQYVARRFSVSLDPDQHILPLSGAKEAVFHLPQFVIDPAADDRAVVFPDPGYPAYCRGTLFAGGEPIAVSLSGDCVFRPWELPGSVLKRTRLMWINSPHNPTGAVMSLEDLEQTVEVCRRFDILLAADETYADIYNQEPPHSVLECGLTGVLALHSLSKRSGMTGYRSGFIAGDAEVLARFRRYRANPGLVPQTFINAAATVAWADDEHVAERRKIFSQKKRLFLDLFDELGWFTVGRDATLYLWVSVPAEDSAAAWADRLLEHGIVVSPGSMFSMTGVGSQSLRIAMVPTIAECQQAIDIWRSLV